MRVLSHPAIEETLTTEVTLADAQEYAGQLALKRRLAVDAVWADWLSRIPIHRSHGGGCQSERPARPRGSHPWAEAPGAGLRPIRRRRSVRSRCFHRVRPGASSSETTRRHRPQMNVLLLDTSVVSILFNRNRPLRQTCTEAVAGRQLVISFTTQAELRLWPAANDWGAARRTALYPDERTCAIWAGLVEQCRRSGRPIQTADAWIAASARLWGCPLVTTDLRDYAAIEDLDVVPIR